MNCREVWRYRRLDHSLLKCPLTAAEDMMLSWFDKEAEEDELDAAARLAA